MSIKVAPTLKLRMINMGIQKEEAIKRAKEENGSLKMQGRVKAVSIKKTVYPCPKCNSHNTYFNKEELVCRKCRHREQL